MDDDPRLVDLSRHERSALRRLLVGAVRDVHRDVSSPCEELAGIVTSAPIGALPAAASLHRLSGSVRRGLGAVHEIVPAAVLDELSCDQQRSALNHLMVMGALGEVAPAFDRAGLTWLVMKGPVVASMYPDVGDRSYADLDLLVSRADFPAAIELLEQLGYAHHIHDWALAETMMAGQVTMSSPLAAIDVHWHLHYSTRDRLQYTLDPDGLLERRRIVEASGACLPTLDPVDTVVTLAFHAARSDGHRLMWLKDIDRAIAVGGPDLDEVVRRSRAARCGPQVGSMLARARRLVGAEVPDEVVGRLTPASLRAIDRAVCAVQDPIQFHERPTITRAVTRSVRGTLPSTVAALAPRGLSMVRRRVRPQVPTESDRPHEKARYLAAVASAPDR